MSLPRVAIVVCFAVLLGVPLAFRPRDQAITASGGSTLIIITPHNEQIRFEFARGFDRWHQRHFGQGVNIDYNVPGGTSEIRRMLESQFTAALTAGREPGGDADLVFGGGSFEHDRLKRGVRTHDHLGRERQVSISQPIDFTADWLDETYRENRIGDQRLYDPERHWFGLALSGFGIVFNRDALRSLDVAEPRAWVDMSNPRLRGWIALVNPAQSGSVASAFEAILKREGWIRGWQILRRMAANARYFSASSLKPPLDVAMGDAAMGVCIDFYGRFQSQALKEAGDPDRLGYVDPPGGSTLDPDPISMLRNAPHPELARRFVEFCLSDEGQALWQFAANARGSGDGLGPRQFELRRLPIRRSIFERFMPRLIDQLDPYEIATPPRYPDANYRDFIAPMFAAMTIDVHQELRDAWSAIVEHPAYPLDVSGMITAEDVADPELKRMLVAFDALPVIPGPDGAAFDLADTDALVRAREVWIRGSGEGHGLWHPEASSIDALKNRLRLFFRSQYQAAAGRLPLGETP